MSKVANMLNMVLYLSNRNTVKIKEIANYLEVTESTVRLYKNELEQANIYIESRRGRYGGYSLDRQRILRYVGLNEDEKFALDLGTNYLSKKKDFPHIDYYKSAIDKILYENTTRINDHQNVINKGEENAYFDTVSKYYDIIYNAIIRKKKLKINYYSLKSNQTKYRVVHPYGILSYKGYNYLVAYCEIRKKILDFKLVRIRNIEGLNINFIRTKEFNLMGYKKSYFGIYNDEIIDLELKIDHPKSQIVKESIYVKNQEIIEQKTGIIFKAKMNSKVEVITWILSLGSSVEIIKPNSLKNEIYKEIQKMNKNHKP